MNNLSIEQLLHKNSLILAAKDYLKKKLSIIPVGKNKIPLIPWKEFSGRFATPEEVDGWFERFPNAQIGIVTGKISGITIVDVEVEGGEKEWNKLPQVGPIVKTQSGGRHYWFLYEENIKNSVKIGGEMNFTDIRNDGGYCILPPSIADKGSYEWVQKRPPISFPGHLFKIPSKDGYLLEKKNVVEQTGLLGLYPGHGSGTRNNEMVRYIGFVLTQIHPEDWEKTAWPLIMEANYKNIPPLGERELRASYDSIRNKDKGSGTSKWIGGGMDLLPPDIKKNLKIKKDYRLRYTWGTRGLDTSFAIIKRGNFIVFGAKASSGKTTMAFDMAQKNALLGHKILFLSLEMDEKEVKESVARKRAGITIEEEYDYAIPDYKQRYFKQKLEEINSIKNLHFKGVRRGGGLKWEELLKIIYEYEELDLIIIDNLDLIEGNRGENDLDRQKRIVKNIMGFTSEMQIPIILIHHYRKSFGKDAGKGGTLDDLSGSMKIVDGADRIINISRNKAADATYPEKYKSIVYLQKGREYTEGIRNIYFIEGTFVDTPPVINDYGEIADKTAEEFLKEEGLKKELESKEEESSFNFYKF